MTTTNPTPSRFWLFGGDKEEKQGGYLDYISDFPTEKAAREGAKKDNLLWFHVLDSETRQVV